MTKPLHAGNAAQMGIVAARLAQKGFTADKNILEAKFGFCDLFSGGHKYNINKITENLGHPLAIITPGVNLKPYPSCRYTHAALDAMLELVSKETFLVEDVESIEVRVVPVTAQILIHPNPRSALEGKFSMEFCIATAILRKQVKLESFTDENVLNGGTQDMMKKVKMVADPKLEGSESPTVLKIRLKNGKEYSKQVNRPKGNPDVPMSRNEFLAKYRDCAGRVLAADAANRVLDMIENMESVTNLRKLGDLLIGYN
jgi:2-methylcitrate dehydratase PrpD